jgi:glycosyltransferase involved in cell wall biosynthesis
VSPGPRTVLYVHSSAERYGSDRQLALITSGLDPDRYRPLVVLPDNGPLVDDLRAADVDVRVRDLAVLRRELFQPAPVARLAGRWAADAAALGRLARAEQVALVHSNTSVTLGGAAAAGVARLPHVWHVREIYSRWERWWPAWRRVLAGADALPCVSEAARSQFDGLGPTRVLHDGLAGPAERMERAAARRALGLDPDVFVCLLLGRVSEWKGQLQLAAALGRPELEKRGAVGLIAGETWPGQEERGEPLRAAAERLGLEDRLRLLGFREDTPTLYGAADVVVVPSTEPDPLPNSALEAGAAGCCVVAAHTGGIPEILHEGETGRLVAPGDSVALARVLAELGDDPDQRARLGAAAAEDVHQRFAPDRLLAQVQDLYDELLSR